VSGTCRGIAIFALASWGSPTGVDRALFVPGAEAKSVLEGPLKFAGALCGSGGSVSCPFPFFMLGKTKY
jgi:hypothetical protein